ncbi:MAG TPA: hypothetical protein IAA59_12660 [Candidatus Faecaligallichristensenella faecipullorum]|nr:hypothetical protein [Candidatus Faecaligallichristensenella faecipullorum]
MMSAKRIKKPLAALLLLACLLLTGCQESISSLVGKPLSEVSAMFDQDAKEDRGGLQIYRSDSVQLVFSSEDTVTGYAYYNTEGEFIRSAGVIPVDRQTLLSFDSMSELEEALCPPQCTLGEEALPGYVTLDGLLVAIKTEGDRITGHTLWRLSDGAEVTAEELDKA